MGERLSVSPQCAIDSSELEIKFSPSGGPGGQHANRSSTRAEIRFNAAESPSLTEAQRAMIVDKLGAEVRSVCDEHRSQLRNREEAQERLLGRLAAALVREKPRRKTKPSRGAKQRRLKAKKERSEIKKGRSGKNWD